jgi:hypothetical protein
MPPCGSERAPVPLSLRARLFQRLDGRLGKAVRGTIADTGEQGSNAGSHADAA